MHFLNYHFSVLLRGSTHAGEGRVQDNMHAYAQNTAITGRQRLGKTIHITRIGKACPGQVANHVPEYSQIIKVLN